jgi:hypothetical protein
MVFKKYLCLTDCFHQGYYYRAFKEYELPSDPKPPHHFEPVESEKAKAMLLLVKRERELNILRDDKSNNPANKDRIKDLETEIDDLKEKVKEKDKAEKKQEKDK